MVKLMSISFFVIFCCTTYAQDLPLLGLAHAGLRVSDLDKARSFYGDVLGYDVAFTTRNPDGSVRIAYYKINDKQFIEISPGLQQGEVLAMTHVAMYTNDIQKLHQMMADRGIAVTRINKGPRDGNLSFSVRNLPGQDLRFLEFVEYQPDSLHTKSAGKFLSDRRISTHLLHVGIITTDFDAAYNFYVKSLGFTDTWHRTNPKTQKMTLVHLHLPGGNHDFIELSNLSGETKLTRVRAGEAAHISLEVPDIQAALKEVKKRSPQMAIKPPRFGLDDRWQFNIFDPDGTRIEMMEPKKQAKAGIPVQPGN